MTGVGAQLEHLAAQSAAAAGAELVQVEVCGQGNSRLLRVLLDKPGGIALDDCERVSHALSQALDADESVMPGNYILEVSSPGLDRPLVKPADYARFAGQRARVKTRLPVAGSRNFVGAILASEATGVRLQPEERGREAVLLPWDLVASARLVPTSAGLGDTQMPGSRATASAKRDARPTPARANK